MPKGHVEGGCQTGPYFEALAGYQRACPSHQRCWNCSSFFFFFFLVKKAYMSIDANLVSNPKDR